MLILRRVALFVGLAVLAACAKNDLEDPPVQLGDFALGLNIAVADNAQKVPISREASADEWEAVMKAAVADRFGRYSGGRLYNIGISIDGYALAPPGIPVVAAPKSVLVITANIWDDATQTKLNAEGEQFTVFEGMSGETVIGTGGLRRGCWSIRNGSPPPVACRFPSLPRERPRRLRHLPLPGLRQCRQPP